MAKKSYSRDIDILIALVSYLSMTEYRSMRPSKIAQRLSLERERVEEVLENYKGLFRKSTNKTHEETGEHYYTLHIRYAMRWLNEDDSMSETTPPKLPAEYITTILNFLSDRVKQEETQRTEQVKNLITMIAAIIAAFASIATVIMSVN
jgi:hypothetical protein